MKMYAAGVAPSTVPDSMAFRGDEAGDTASPGADSSGVVAPALDCIDRTEARCSRGGRNIAIQIPDHPQGDVYSSEGHAAIWQAYYLRQPDGFSGGRGPKIPEQMAFIIKRQLQQDFDAAKVPIHFSAVPQSDRSAAAYVVSGRDTSGSGLDISIGRDGSVHMETYELHRAQDILSASFRWHAEKHDTGYLERHFDDLKRGVWLPDNTGNVMTGKDT